MKAMTVAVSLKAKDGISPIISKVNSKLESFESRLTKVRNTSAKIGAVSMAGFAGMATVLRKPIDSAIAFESAMADVKKVVNFTPNTKEFKAFGDEILTLSTKIPLAATELATIAASGGQLGIAKDSIIGFTTVVAKMSTAFDMMPNEAGDSIAKLMNIYGLSIKEATSLGDAVNHLSDNTAAKAKEMISIVSKTGGMAKAFGLNAVQVAALGDAFLSMGMAPDVASTSINAMLTKLSAADKQGKKFQKGLKAIGLDAKQMGHMIEKDANGAIIKVLKSLKHLDKRKQTGVLLDLFGMEYASKIALVVNGLENYEKALELVSDKSKYVASMQKEFETRSATTENQMKLLGNSMDRIGVTVGSVLLPPLNKAITAVSSLADKIFKWTKAHPKLTQNIMETAGTITMAVGGLGALAVGFSAVTFLLSPFIKTFKGIGWALGNFGAKSATATTAVKALDTTLGAISGKSFMTKMGVQMPNKGALVSEATSIRTALVAALANPIMIAAVVTAGTVGAMASAQHTQIMDNRAAKSSDSTDELKAKITRYEERIKAMKGEGDFTGRAKEWLLNGNATESEIKQQEKLLAVAKKRLAQKAPQPKAVKTEGVQAKNIAKTNTIHKQTTIEAKKITVTAVASPVVVSKPKVWSKEKIAEARANAYRARDARKAEVSKSIQKVELKKPIVKRVTNTKNISVSPTINITVNAVQGKVDTHSLGQDVSKHIEASARNLGSPSDFEDQE